MAIRQNAVYNNAAFSDIGTAVAKAFAPLSGADAHGWASAAAKRAEAQRLQDAFATITAPGTSREIADRFAIGAGMFSPSQSYYAVDQSNATSRANNAADNDRALKTSLLAPLSKDQVRFNPPDIAERFDLPAQQTGIVELDQGKTYKMPGQEGYIAGPAKPLTAEEVRGNIIQGLSPELQQAIGFGSTPVESVVGPDGKPQIKTRLDSLGLQPAPTGEAALKKTNAAWVRPDGTLGPALQGADGSWVDAQTGQKLPTDVRITDMPRPQGSAADLGLSKPVKTQIEKQFLDIATTRSMADNLLREIQANPASQGIVGSLRGTVQDVVQTGGELGRFFGGAIEQTRKDVQAGLLPPEFAAETYDPSIPAIKALGNLLVAQYARVMMPGDRVSQQFINDTREALGLDGMLANQERAKAAISAIVKMINDQETILKQAYSGGAQSVTQQGGGAPSLRSGDMIRDVNAAAGSQEQQEQRFQERVGGPVDVRTPEEAMALPSGTRFRTPDGREKVRP